MLIRCAGCFQVYTDEGVVFCLGKWVRQDGKMRYYCFKCKGKVSD